MEKPDFESQSKTIYPTERRQKAFQEGCEHVWNTHVVPLESENKALREENTRLTTNFIEHENAAESPNDHLSYWQYQQFTRAAITKLKEELVTTEKALRDQLEACEQHNKILCEQKLESLKEIERLEAEVLKEKFPEN